MKQTLMKNRKNQRGSMTVEAVIALPVFLMFFMFMMYMVNVCNAYLALNHAVDQTTKFTSNQTYLYTKVSGKLNPEDDWEKFNESKNSLLSDAVEEVIMSGKFSKGYDIAEEVIVNYLRAKFKTILSDVVTGTMESYFLERSKERLLILIDGSKIDGSRVELTLYKLPEGELLGTEAEKYDGSFGENDIVVQAVYHMQIELPLMEPFDFPIVSTCVEKGFTIGAREEFVTLEDTSFIKKLL